MSGSTPTWNVCLSDRALADYRDILTWTAEEFGERQASAYQRVLSSAIDALALGPQTVGVKNQSKLAHGVLALHVARGKSRGRHVIFFRVASSQSRTIEVIRVPRDAMDFARHVRGKRA